MEWNRLLSTYKLADEETEPSCFQYYPVNSFEKDYNKIVSSAAFRRLQDKTQVFPLDKSDFIRTRLTHSIEVSTIARQLGIMITKNTNENRQLNLEENDAEVIPSVLLCAGLLHDLGNPPFGHFGETIIGNWFKDNLKKITYKNQPLSTIFTPQMINDLENFEGNAQSLRILLKAKHGSGINLSAAVISSLVKYPTDSLSFNDDDTEIKKHKFGYFSSEQDTFSQISQIVGTQNEAGEIARHPLAFIIEAADDIAYATADLEDAFKKKLFTVDAFINYFESSYSKDEAEDTNNSACYSQRLIEDLKNRRGEKPTNENDYKAFMEWTVYTRRWLMYVVAYRFYHSYRKIMSGRYMQDLFYNTNHSKTIKILKDAMPKFVFDSPQILKIELASQSIISFLLSKFVNATLYYGVKDDKFKLSKADKKYLSIFSNNYIEDYKVSCTGDETKDLYLRMLMVTDYISGMTDSYARTLYRELSGIE